MSRNGKVNLSLWGEEKGRVRVNGSVGSQLSEYQLDQSHKLNFRKSMGKGKIKSRRTLNVAGSPGDLGSVGF